MVLIYTGSWFFNVFGEKENQDAFKDEESLPQDGADVSNKEQADRFCIDYKARKVIIRPTGELKILINISESGLKVS